MNNVIYKTKLGAIITPYKPKKHYDLEKKVSIRNEAYHRYDEYAGFYGLYKGMNAYITYDHLDLNLPKYGNYTVQNLPVIKPKKIKKKFKITGVDKLRASQSQILNQLSYDNPNGNAWYINLPTGEGKTILSMYIASILGLKTMVVCYSINILDGWVRTLSNYTNIDMNRVLRLDSTALSRLQKGKISYDDYDIFIMSTGFINRRISSIGDYSFIEELMENCGIGLLIYDEAHRHVSTLVKLLSCANVKYQLLLSAEDVQGDYIKNIIFQGIIRKVKMLKITEELADTLKYTKLAVVEYNSKPTMLEERSVYGQYGYNDFLFIKHQLDKGILFDALEYVIGNIIMTDPLHRILVLFTSVEATKQFYERISHVVQDKKYDMTVGIYHGETSSTHKNEVMNTASIIVATYGSFSTGLDTENIKYVLSTGQGNKINDNQAAGRARPLSDGSNAMYFIFIDSGISYCKKKLNSRLAYLMEKKSVSEKPDYFKYSDGIF